MTTQTIEIPVKGMDCAACVKHVQEAIERLPGVSSVNVLLSSEKLLPPIFAAAAQSLPDLGILANSLRLPHYRAPREHHSEKQS